MADKQIQIRCSTGVAHIVFRAMVDFAHAAYPEGGSECAQNTRYTLLQTARRIHDEISATGTAQVSRRLRAVLRSALNYHCERLLGEAGPGSHQCKLLVGLLNGVEVSDAILHEAAAQDVPLCGLLPRAGEPFEM